MNIPNSMTVLTEMLPVSLVMAEKQLTGVYNFCNPGAISHNECLALYKKHVDPAYTWENFTVEEQDKILKAARSNNTLTHDKLMDAIPAGMVNEIHVAMEECMKRMKVNLEKEGLWPDNLPTRRG